jgi:hypothetical protein
LQACLRRFCPLPPLGNLFYPFSGHQRAPKGTKEITMKIAKVIHHGQTRYRVNDPSGSDGKRQRKFFETREAAESYRCRRKLAVRYDAGACCPRFEGGSY